MSVPEVVIILPTAPPTAKIKSTAKRKKAAAIAQAPPSKAPPPATPVNVDQAAPPTLSPEAAARLQVAEQIKSFDASAQSLQPKVGATSYAVTKDAIQALPQGDSAPFDKVLLQVPGVTQDSAASGDIHVRNEHGNLQYRVNGIILPEGVGGFGQILETGFVGSFSLLTGALPAQYGLRTSGVIDIQTRKGNATPEGTVGIYGGSQSTIMPSIDYGGTLGTTDFFFSSRGFWNDEGIENPTARVSAIHDETQQGKAFSYVSKILDESTRITSISGVSVQRYQIPNNPGQPPQFTVGGISDFDSGLLNQRQIEQNFFSVLAWQKKSSDSDLQVAAFTRYSNVHFRPDPVGDLVFNGVASDVNRTSLLNGLQADAALHINSAHTLRGGILVSAESTRVTNASTVLPLDGFGNPVDAPFGLVDETSKTGWIFGAYVQDEWKLTDQLTLNAGLRFDQMVQYVDANQLSPRIGLTYTPTDGTTLHAGYARYFTPPSQIEAGPTNIALFQNTTAQSVVTASSPVLPERSHYFDVGITQKIIPGFEMGVDGYYKIARDLLDDGQFGQAYVLRGFNYERATNYGVEVQIKYETGGLRLYGNVAWAQQKARNVVSNQFLFDPDRLSYIATHDIFTDHAQTWTGSAGVSYLWNATRLSADLVTGSGLRSGFANTTHVPAYAQVNVGLSHEFKQPDAKPLTVRFDVINVFDQVYQLRDGSGIGVFAPQYGPRREYFVGLSRKF